VTTPDTKTKSIGLLAIAPLSWFLHRHLDSFIMTGQILPIYRDSAIGTISSGRENSYPFTGTLQKRMPTPTQTATPHTTGPLAARQIASSHCTWTSDARARVLQPIPATVPSLQNTTCPDTSGCFFAYPDSARLDNLS
jgi:hypothetical protein